jgi:hypothetical protein
LQLQHPKSITALRVTFFKFPPLVIGSSDCLQATVINDVRPYESIGRFRAPKGEKHETDTPTYFGTVNRRRRACCDRVIAKVRYPDVYQGIDVVYYGNQGRLEYDFIIAPDADPSAITLGFSGATAEIDNNSAPSL